MKLSAIIAPLIAAKVPHEIIMQTVQAWEAEQEDALEKRRASDRERQAKKRSRHVMSRDVTVTVPSHDAPATRVEDNLQTKIIPEKEEKKGKREASPRDDIPGFKSELSSILDEDRIDALIAVRRKKNAAVSAHTGKLLVSAIGKCDQSPADVADEMALRNWTSVKPDWLERSSSRGPPQGSVHQFPNNRTGGGHERPNAQQQIEHELSIFRDIERRVTAGGDGV